MNLLDDLDRFRQIDKDFNAILYDCFHGLILDGNGQSGPVFRAYMHIQNKQYVNTEYYYKGKKEFFHLTSVNNLLSILNSRSFRLYNLHTANDSDEYGYVGNILELPEWKIKQAKHHLYTLSFCPISEINNETVWNIYGKALGGVAIIFSVDNDPSDWIKFHLSEIKYDSPENFLNYKNRIEGLKQKYKGCEFECDLSPLICFHKSAKWKEEKEVRIATYLPYDGFEEMWKYSKPDVRLEKGRNRIVSYIELPLWVDNESPQLKSEWKEELNRTQDLPTEYFISHPLIRVNEIKFGKNCGIEEKEFDTYRRMIREIFQMNYGYEIHIDYDLFSF